MQPAQGLHKDTTAAHRQRSAHPLEGAGAARGAAARGALLKPEEPPIRPEDLAASASWGASTLPKTRQAARAATARAAGFCSGSCSGKLSFLACLATGCAATLGARLQCLHAWEGEGQQHTGARPGGAGQGCSRTQAGSEAGKQVSRGRAWGEQGSFCIRVCGSGEGPEGEPCLRVVNTGLLAGSECAHSVLACPVVHQRIATCSCSSGSSLGSLPALSQVGIDHRRNLVEALVDDCNKCAH